MLNMTEDQFLKMTNMVVYTVICGVSLIYQGLVAAYYARRRRTIKQALGEM